MKVDREFWKNRKVFVTGHTGFKGSWLCLWLQEMGAQVRGYALSPPTQPSLFELAAVGEEMDSVIGDIRHFQFLKETLKEFNPEIIFHLAAQPLVRVSYAQPLETFETNVMGTVHILNAARLLPGVKALVNVTTDKCYENREWVWGYRENEPLGGYDPYSSSKACSELITNAFSQSYFNPMSTGFSGCNVATARAGNIVGGGDWAVDRLIPDVLRGFENKAPVEIRSPRALRPWQYVLEPLSGYLNLAQRLVEDGAEFAEAWNFGPTNEDTKTVEWIVKRLADEWGEGAEWHLSEGSHPHETQCLRLDCSKAATRLHWATQWSLTHSLRKIVAWHKAHMNDVPMRGYTLNEIKEYQFSH